MAPRPRGRGPRGPVPRRPLPPAALVLLGVAVVLTGCAPNDDAPRNDEPMPEQTIQEVLEAHTDEWMALPGVVGTGIGLCNDDEPCIRIFLSETTPETEEKIPSEVGGYPVELVVTGPFEPRDPPGPADEPPAGAG